MVPVFAGFVRVDGEGFEIDGKPYRFVGTNFWYAMNLDRERLVRELDRMRSTGITNVRVMAASEGPDGQPWRMAPSLQTAPGSYNQSILNNLEYLFGQLRVRGIYAVVCLNNFWPWSGGMAQYVNWAGGGAIPYPPPEPNGSWSKFQSYSAIFYSSVVARERFGDFLRLIVPRFKNETAIMAWELANEPRGDSAPELLTSWINETASLIKGLDPNHLVTTGSEGETPWPRSNGLDFKKNHSSSSIDYATIHIWAENWFWYDPKRADATLRFALDEMRDYLWRHANMAHSIGKPMVVEEFGLARDDGDFRPGSSTHFRDRYYEEVFEEARLHAAGVNFWAWAGEGRPRVPGGHWHFEDPFTGDPPHEPQGWYGVYDEDQSTLRVVRAAARKTPGAL